MLLEDKDLTVFVYNLRITCITISYQYTDSMNVTGSSYKQLQRTLIMERTKSHERAAVAAEAVTAGGG